MQAILRDAISNVKCVYIEQGFPGTVPGILEKRDRKECPGNDSDVRRKSFCGSFNKTKINDSSVAIK